MTDTAQVISQTLQSNWSLSSPKASDISWPCTRFESADLTKITQNYVVACYNPASPVASEPLSREVWQLTEDVVVDVIVRVTGTAQQALDARESVRLEIYRILHSNELSIPGIPVAYVAREPYKVESPDLARIALQVKCKTFHIKT
jgi:hypothetical protein